MQEASCLKVVKDLLHLTGVLAGITHELRSNVVTSRHCGLLQQHCCCKAKPAFAKSFVNAQYYYEHHRRCYCCVVFRNKLKTRLAFVWGSPGSGAILGQRGGLPPSDILQDSTYKSRRQPKAQPVPTPQSLLTGELHVALTGDRQC